MRRTERNQLAPLLEAFCSVWFRSKPVLIRLLATAEPVTTHNIKRIGKIIIFIKHINILPIKSIVCKKLVLLVLFIKEFFNYKYS